MSKYRLTREQKRLIADTYSGGGWLVPIYFYISRSGHWRVSDQSPEQIGEEPLLTHTVMLDVHADLACSMLEEFFARAADSGYLLSDDYTWEPTQPNQHS